MFFLGYPPVLIFWLLLISTVHPILRPCMTDHRCTQCDGSLQKMKDLQANWHLHPGESISPLVHSTGLLANSLYRVLEHAATTMATSVFLGRPYILELDRADPDFIIRSLLEPNEYDWRIPTWLNIDESYHISTGKNYERMEKDIDGTSRKLEDLLERWDGSNSQLKHKAIISLDWGDVWFPKLGHLKSYQAFWRSLKCDNRATRDAAFHFLFRPTALLKQKADEWTLQQRKEYGHIHGAFFIEIKGGNYNIKEMKKSLDACTKTAPEIKYWWVLSNTPHVAQDISVLDNSKYACPYDKKNKLKDFIERTSDAGATHIMEWYLLYSSKVAFADKNQFSGSAGFASKKSSTKANCGKFKHVWKTRVFPTSSPLAPSPSMQLPIFKSTRHPLSPSRLLSFRPFPPSYYNSPKKSNNIPIDFKSINMHTNTDFKNINMDNSNNSVIIHLSPNDVTTNIVIIFLLLIVIGLLVINILILSKDNELINDQLRKH